MIDKSELDRVRGIRRVLDLWAAMPDIFSKAEYRDGGTGNVYTAAEVAKWPETKRELSRVLLAHPGSNVSAMRSVGDIGANATFAGSPAFQKAVARGLCMYREMLSDAPEPRSPHTGPTAAEVREAYGAAIPPAPSQECCCPHLNGKRAGFTNVCPVHGALPAKPEPKPTARVWDSSQYNGIDAATYQQLSTLDKRIAAAKEQVRAEFDQSSDERRRRLLGTRFDGLACHEWPKGDERNEP